MTSQDCDYPETLSTRCGALPVREIQIGTRPLFRCPAHTASYLTGKIEEQLLRDDDPFTDALVAKLLELLHIDPGNAYPGDGALALPALGE